jgi:hypothetical protein
VRTTIGKIQQRRVVVCALGGFVRPPYLPASSFLDRPWIHGGERTLYEIAAAVALVGHRVELRGDLSRPALEAIVTATGARIETDLPPRQRNLDDVVIVPEGISDPLFYSGIGIPGARTVMVLLGPPGLFGPALSPGFSAPDPLTVLLDGVGTPDQYRQLTGFELWTNSPRIAAEARDAGLECLFIGTGQPLPFPTGVVKSHGVAYVAANRWALLARAVASTLSRPSLEIPEGDRDSTLRRLSAARLLLLPARIEGQSRLQLEARAIGTVPVALSSNRYAVGMDERGGAVLVDSLEEMGPVVDELLGYPGRLAELARRAVTTARAQMDWDAYVRRVAGALRPGSSRPGRRIADAPVGHQEAEKRMGRTL